MKKTLALLLVASLLLAGCTELSESDDGETLNIEVNEDIAIEKINDFMTVDENEAFGITMMYDMDPSMMGMEGGMLEVDEDSEAVITMEMTEAWSPDGYHTSEISGISNGDSSMKFVSTMTHIGTTMYFEIGYETQGDLCADEETQEEKEMCEMMYGDMPAVQSYSMTTTTTHTEVIAAMAEESQNDGDEMDPMAMLSFLSFVECYGEFTPADSIDGLQIFDVSMDITEDDSITPKSALCMFDMDDSNTINFEEFLAADDSGEEVDDEEVAELKVIFDESDIDADGELNSDELVTFIEAMDNYDEEHDEGDDHDHGSDHDGHDDMGDDEDPEMMPDMSVAFNDAGEIEYFSMSMEGTEMKMYVLTEDRVDSLFTDVNAGTLVALPFSITGSMDDDDEMFMCNDGEMIPMDYVNDGWDDCDGGEDEWDDNSGGSEDEFVCDDGDTIPMDWVNDGMNDCAGGEDEFDDSEDIGNLYDGCTESTDPADSYYECWMNDWLDSDGNIMMSDGYEMDECTELADGSGWDCLRQDSSIDDMIEEWLAFMDADGDGNITWDEHDAFINSEEGWESDEERNDSMMIWSDLDADSNGGLDADELVELFALLMEYDDDDDHDHGDDHDDHGDEDMVCYDMDTHLIDDSIDNQADCEAAGYIWTEDQSDDHDDHGDHDDSGEIVMYISNEMDFHFEGDMSDYKIELSSCDYDYDMETGEETSTCTTVISVAIADAGMDSDIMFHDADSSGTVSVGDMIHIGETDVEWDEVRLYSISADAYSDENPMHNAPGFTGLVGMLALLGAAFIRRNE